MEKALPHTGRNAGKETQGAGRHGLDWRRRMSDHIAYALLAYTGLQIFVTMTALKSGTGSILPYFALVVLVAAIIPGCRMFERRWEGLSDERAFVWLAAIGLPFIVTGLLKALTLLL